MAEKMEQVKLKPLTAEQMTGLHYLRPNIYLAAAFDSLVVGCTEWDNRWEILCSRSSNGRMLAVGRKTYNLGG